MDKGKGRASEEEINEVIESEAMRRVERMGLKVGGYIAEKSVVRRRFTSSADLVRLTLARPPLATQLDIIKFICKDLFLYVYSKQIDNLRTNHRVRAFPSVVAPA